MEQLLREIDKILARFEGFTYGKDGEEITKMWGKIASELKAIEWLHKRVAEISKID